MPEVRLKVVLWWGGDGLGRSVNLGGGGVLCSCIIQARREGTPNIDNIPRSIIPMWHQGYCKHTASNSLHHLVPR